VDKVSGPTCRSVGLLAGWVHLIGTSGTLAGGDPWVPMSLKEVEEIVVVSSNRGSRKGGRRCSPPKGPFRSQFTPTII
jgi:hypothetical protein